MNIREVRARELLDSRGNPTLEVDVELDSGSIGRAMVPSGASTGAYEAVELRDGDTGRYLGKGTLKAVDNIRTEIASRLIGRDAVGQSEIDEAMIKLDGSPNKSRLGANAILAVSLGCARAAANAVGVPLYQFLGGEAAMTLPVPMMNILNGGAHSDNNVDFQEFMVMPIGASSFGDGLRMGTEVFHHLKQVLRSQGLNTAVGDEGGFAPNLPRNEDGLRHVLGAIERAGYMPGEQISIALDCAAEEFHRDDGYHIDGKVMSGSELGGLYSSWLDNYPIVSLEDAFGEDDWGSWVEFTAREGGRVQIVGDDLYVTNPTRFTRGIAEGASNAILIKLNQIGTVTETLRVMEMARTSGFATVISHRSGETSDDIIADFAVGTDAKQIKTGAPARSDRTSKYNQLLRIAEQCSDFTDLF